MHIGANVRYDTHSDTKCACMVHISARDREQFRSFIEKYKFRLWCRLQQYRLFTFFYHSFYFFGIWLSVQICVFSLLWFFLSLTQVVCSAFGLFFSLCENLCDTRLCRISLFQFNVALQKYCVALIVTEIIYLLRICRDMCCNKTTGKWTHILLLRWKTWTQFLVDSSHM